MKLILISIRKREAGAMLKGDHSTHDTYPGSKSGANLFKYFIYLQK